jgi:hypothetical protein
MSARRMSTAIAVLAMSAALSPAVAQANRPAGEGGSPQPSVDMQRVLLAAQLDPARPGNEGTAGSRASVHRVEQALAGKGLLARTYVDGSFGSKTREAYSAWQGRLGYSGLAANGLPGESSLRQLGAGRFTVKRVVSPGPRVQVSGVTINRRTNRMKKAAGAILRGSFRCTLDVVQGSYNAGGVSASAGTHDGGGAMDISVKRGCGLHKAATVAALRRVGFAAWYRPTIPGTWEEHIHAIAISDSDLSSGAAAQVADYWFGRDGLAGHGPDTGPQVPKTTWEQFRRSH